MYISERKMTRNRICLSFYRFIVGFLWFSIFANAVKATQRCWCHEYM